MIYWGYLLIGKNYIIKKISRVYTWNLGNFEQKTNKILLGEWKSGFKARYTLCTYFFYTNFRGFHHFSLLTLVVEFFFRVVASFCNQDKQSKMMLKHENTCTVNVRKLDIRISAFAKSVRLLNGSVIERRLITRRYSSVIGRSVH